MDNKTKVSIAFPLIFIIVALLAGSYIHFEGGHTEAEKLVLDFRLTDLTINKKQKTGISGMLTGLFHFPGSAGSEGVVRRQNPFHPGDQIGSNLTLIVISDQTKMAMIDGMLVKEGDKIDDKRVVRIEPDKVLIRDRSSQWLHLGRIQ